MSIVTRIAAIRRGDRTAIHNIVMMAASARVAISPRPWLNEPNSSSSSGADPGEANGHAMRRDPEGPRAAAARGQNPSHPRQAAAVCKSRTGRGEDDVAQQSSIGGLVRYHRLPGEIGGLAGPHEIECIGELADRTIKVGKRRLTGSDTLQGRRKGGHQAAQARIGRQLTQERLRLDQLVERRVDLGCRL